MCIKYTFTTLHKSNVHFIKHEGSNPNQTEISGNELLAYPLKVYTRSIDPFL